MSDALRNPVLGGGPRWGLGAPTDTLIPTAAAASTVAAAFASQPRPPPPGRAEERTHSRPPPAWLRRHSEACGCPEQKAIASARGRGGCIRTQVKSTSFCGCRSGAVKQAFPAVLGQHVRSGPLTLRSPPVGGPRTWRYRRFCGDATAATPPQTPHLRNRT